MKWKESIFMKEYPTINFYKLPLGQQVSLSLSLSLSLCGILCNCCIQHPSDLEVG